jgi:energy-coupling factor transporter ATP-binding protein EcfA2
MIGLVKIESPSKTLIDRINTENKWLDQIIKGETLNRELLEGEISTGKEMIERDIENRKYHITYEDMILLQEEVKRLTSKDKKWVDCKCDIFKQLWSKESESTIYMLRFLSKSCMFVKGTPPIISVKKYSKKWSECIWDVRLNVEEQTRRIIMGYGPSGCGKSTIAKELFKCVPDINVVWTVDGGISREESISWRIASLTPKQPNVVGISNLYKMFKEINESKDAVLPFIQRSPVSIYVPDTLSSVDKMNTVKSKLGQYTGIRSLTRAANMSMYTRLDPNWIALLIWQHKNYPTNTCTYPFRCKGCDVSGLKRALTEGKKYDSLAYDISMDIGYKTVLTSTTQIIIHNSGQAGVKSIMCTNSNSIYKCIKENENFVVFEHTLPLTQEIFMNNLKTRIQQYKTGTVVEKDVMSSVIDRLNVIEKRVSELSLSQSSEDSETMEGKMNYVLDKLRDMEESHKTITEHQKMLEESMPKELPRQTQRRRWFGGRTKRFKKQVKK